MLGIDRLLFIPRSLFMIAIYILQHLAFMRGLRGLRRGYVQQLAASQMVCVVHKISMHEHCVLVDVLRPLRTTEICNSPTDRWIVPRVEQIGFCLGFGWWGYGGRPWGRDSRASERSFSRQRPPPPSRPSSFPPNSIKGKGGTCFIRAILIWHPHQGAIISKSSRMGKRRGSKKHKMLSSFKNRPQRNAPAPPVLSTREVWWLRMTERP